MRTPGIAASLWLLALAVVAAQAGLLDLADYLAEIHAAFRRCGARWVIGYAAEAFLAAGPG